MRENAIPKGNKDAAKSGVALFKLRQDMKVLLIVIENLVNCSGNVVDVDISIT